jgi:hypothetical protein
LSSKCHFGVFDFVAEKKIYEVIPGTDVMILKKYFWKKMAKCAFLSQNKAKLCKILIIVLVFEKNSIFFTENCRKSQKIVITSSTPGDAENAYL